MSVFDKIDLRDLNLIDNLETGIAIVNYEWVFMYVNKSYAKQMQMNCENIVGRNLFELVQEERTSYLFNNICLQVMNYRSPLEVETRLICNPDYWVHVRVIPIRQGILIKVKNSTLNE